MESGDGPPMELTFDNLHQLRVKFKDEVSRLEAALEQVLNDTESLAAEDTRTVVRDISAALRKSNGIHEDLDAAIDAFREQQATGRGFSQREAELFRFFGFAVPEVTAVRPPPGPPWRELTSALPPEPETDEQDLYLAKLSPEVCPDSGRNSEASGAYRGTSRSPPLPPEAGQPRRTGDAPSAGATDRSAAAQRPPEHDGPSRRSSASAADGEVVALFRIDSARELEAKIGRLVNERVERKLQEQECALRETAAASEANAALADELLDARTEASRLREELEAAGGQLRTTAAELKELREQRDAAAARAEEAEEKARAASVDAESAWGRLRQCEELLQESERRGREAELRLRGAAKPAEVGELREAVQELSALARELSRADEASAAAVSAVCERDAQTRATALRTAEELAAALREAGSGSQHVSTDARRATQVAVRQLGDQLSALAGGASTHAALVEAAAAAAKEHSDELQSVLRPFVYRPPEEGDGGAPPGTSEAALDEAVADILNQLECPVAVDCHKVGAGEYFLDRRLSLCLADGVVSVRHPGGREPLQRYLRRLYAPFLAPVDDGPDVGGAESDAPPPLDAAAAKELEKLQDQQTKLLAQFADAVRKPREAGASSRSSSAVSQSYAQRHSQAGRRSGSHRSPSPPLPGVRPADRLLLPSTQQPVVPQGGMSPPPQHEQVAARQLQQPSPSPQQQPVPQLHAPQQPLLQPAPPPQHAARQLQAVPDSQPQQAHAPQRADQVSPDPQQPLQLGASAQQQQLARSAPGVLSTREAQAHGSTALALMQDLFDAADVARIGLVTKQQLAASCRQNPAAAAQFASTLQLPPPPRTSRSRTAAEAVVASITGGPDRELTFDHVLRAVADYVEATEQQLLEPAPSPPPERPPLPPGRLSVEREVVQGAGYDPPSFTTAPPPSPPPSVHAAQTSHSPPPLPQPVYAAGPLWPSARAGDGGSARTFNMLLQRRQREITREALQSRSGAQPGTPPPRLAVPRTSPPRPPASRVRGGGVSTPPARGARPRAQPQQPPRQRPPDVRQAVRTQPPASRTPGAAPRTGGGAASLRRLLASDA
eukprot:TRINITY_DN28656_c0_g1_i1.p1 TRINITY_DN28656_c0_g1~~TRINITY_DN28656_c0_g1_i1.p1  ORF type:complete len:1088 (+),score=413.45 TRINITY_DN28656_c0_g1_i1:56-3265(+)